MWKYLIKFNKIYLLNKKHYQYNVFLQIAPLLMIRLKLVAQKPNISEFYLTFNRYQVAQFYESFKQNCTTLLKSIVSKFI